VVGEDALLYMEYQGLSQPLLRRLEAAVSGRPKITS